MPNITKRVNLFDLIKDYRPIKHREAICDVTYICNLIRTYIYIPSYKVCNMEFANFVVLCDYFYLFVCMYYNNYRELANLLLKILLYYSITMHLIL